MTKGAICMKRLHFVLALVSCAVAQSNDSDSTFRAQPTYGMMFTFAVLGIDSNNCSNKNFHVDPDAKCYGSLVLGLYVQPGQGLPHVIDTSFVKIPYRYVLPKYPHICVRAIQILRDSSCCQCSTIAAEFYGI
jgi:hypothetical protein